MARIGVAIVAANVVGVMATQPVGACSSEQVAFADAVAQADAFARVVVTETGDRVAEVWRVIEVISGPLRVGELTVSEPRTSLCGDSVGYYATTGGEAIVAFGVPFYGTTVHPMWMATGHPVEPIFATVSGTPGWVRSLDDVEAAIRAALPDTALRRPMWGSAAPIAAGLALLGGSALLVHRRRTRDPRVATG